MHCEETAYRVLSAEGVSFCRAKSGEFRVWLGGDARATAYITTDLEDAVNVGLAMERCRTLDMEWIRTASTPEERSERIAFVQSHRLPAKSLQ